MNTPADTLAALADIRLGIEMDARHMDDAPAKLAALDAALASLKGEAEAVGDVRDYGPVLYCQLPPGTKLYTTPPAPQAGLSAWVSEMKTSTATEYWVCVGWGRNFGEYMTVRMSHMRNRSELEVAEWNHLFGKGTKPCIADPKFSDPEQVSSTPSPAPQGGGEAVKDWRDAQTYDDLYACGIRGFLDMDNRHKPEAEVVAAVKESLAAIERGEFEEVAFIGDDLPPLPEPYFAKDNFLPDKPDEDMYTEEQMREFARDTLNRYAKHFKPTPPAQQPGEVGLPDGAAYILRDQLSRKFAVMLSEKSCAALLTAALAPKEK